MSYTLLQNPISSIGVDISDTNLRFAELIVQKQTGPYAQLHPGKYGQLGIAYDAIENGTIINKTKVIETIKQLREQSQVETVTFTSCGENARDAQWIELFTVGGFTRAHAVSVTDAYQGLIGGTNNTPSIIHFHNETSVTCAISGAIVKSNYPFDVETIMSLQDSVAEHPDSVMQVTGQFLGNYRSIIEDLADYQLYVRPMNVWKNCCDLSQHIPTMTYEETFPYSLSIANAYMACVYDLNNPVLREPKEQTTGNVQQSIQDVELEPVVESKQNVEVPEKHIQKYLPKLKRAILPSLHPTVTHAAQETDIKPIATEPSKEKNSLQSRMQDLEVSPVSEETTQHTQVLKSKPQKEVQISTKDLVVEQAQTPELVEPQDPTPAPVQAQKRSIWLRDVDEMIYGMFGKNTNPEA